jgi:hypothetical protein
MQGKNCYACLLECKLIQSRRKTHGESSKKLQLPYDPAILLLGVCARGMKLHQRDICTPMFVAALFTIAKLWNQPKVSIHNRMSKNVVYIHNEILFRH